MADRMGWADLPPAAKAQIEVRFGAVTAAVTAPPGLTITAAFTADTSCGRLFVKACPGDAPGGKQLAGEIQIGRQLPVGAPTPRLVWATTVEGWHLLAQEYAPGRPARLSPRSPDIPTVLQALHVDLGPPGEARHVAEVQLGPMHARISASLDDTEQPLLKLCRDLLQDWSPHDLPAETLAHGDIHPGNLHVTPHGLRLIDWGLACAAPAWYDSAGLVLRLILSGHPPKVAEGLAAEIPAWETAPEQDVTRYVALMAAFATWARAQGPERLRARRASTAKAAAAWLEARIQHDQ